MYLKIGENIKNYSVCKPYPILLVIVPNINLVLYKMSLEEKKAEINLNSEIEILSKEFKNLQFDADHEIVYGIGKIYSYLELLELSHKYGKAFEACNLYLQNSDMESFLETIKELELEHFLEEVKEIIPVDIYNKVFEP